MEMNPVVPTVDALEVRGPVFLADDRPVDSTYPPIDLRTQTEWIVLSMATQARGFVGQPAIAYHYGPYTAPIPVIEGEVGVLFAPPVPQSVPGGVSVTAQLNGQDVFIGNLSQQYAGAAAPFVPTVGGNCP